jgi:ammonia channel protein AmtB
VWGGGVRHRRRAGLGSNRRLHLDGGEHLRYGRASCIGAVTGAVAGLATRAPALGFIGPVGGFGGQLAAQATGLAVTAVWTAIVTVAIFVVVRRIVG